jgi:cytochrome c oxidase subunit 1
MIATAPLGIRPTSGVYAFAYVVRALAWALIGFAIGAGLTALVRAATGHAPWMLEMNVTIGYAFALPGWLLGIGMWERWTKEWVGQKVETDEPSGLARYLSFTLDHKVIGIQYLGTFVTLFLLAGLFAMLIRVQLLNPTQPVLDQGLYERVMSMHGIIMIAVAVAIITGSFGNYFVPLLLGADDMAFPRLNAFTFWIVPPVAIMLIAAQAFGGWDTGWTAYPPLAETNASGQVFFILAVVTFGLSSILGGLNFIVTTVYCRARGMTWFRVPIFVWGILCSSVIALVFTQFFAASLLMILADRIAGTAFFKAPNGGAPLLYEHVFWFYSHPAVYVMAIPAFGLALEIIPHFARKTLFAYKYAVAAFLSVIVISGGVWAHHMYVSGISSDLLGPFTVTTELVSIPTGIIFLSGLGTIWSGRLWLRVPMLFILGMMFTFLLGGITGIFLADAPTDISLHDTYFVVAHFHYTIVGGEIFALFGGICYWFPKMTGRMYNERLGQIHFWMMTVFFAATFLPLFWVGLHGMNRRVATYPVQLQGVNDFASISAFILGSSFIFFVINMVYSLARGPKAGPNPWKARSLEWQVSSPPPRENFEKTPVVTGPPYDYGEPTSPGERRSSFAWSD